MRELILHCNDQQVDALTDALLEAGVLSTSVEDADVDTPDESPLFGEPGSLAHEQKWPNCRLTVLLPAQLEAQELVTEMEALLSIDLTGWTEQTVEDQDWVRMTQSQFGPIDVSDRLMIVPSWHRDEHEQLIQASEADADKNAPQKVVLELDPGLAFGTGSHPTTHLCLQWLSEHLPVGASVLDYGCGSGILAIAAQRLGAGDVWGVDIDEQAVQTTELNAQINEAKLKVGLPHALPDVQEGGVFDVVVANILSSPLKVLAPLLSARVAPGGHLILSGVLAEQAQDVASFYAPWVSLSVWRTLDGWVCLAGQLEGRSMA